MRLSEIKQYQDWPFTSKNRDKSILFETDLTEDAKERLVREYLQKHPKATMQNVPTDVFNFLLDHTDLETCPGIHVLMERVKEVESGKATLIPAGDTSEERRATLRRLNGENQDSSNGSSFHRYRPKAASPFKRPN